LTLPPDCQDYDDFLAKMRSEGYEIKEGKNLSFWAPGQERFTRSNRLGDTYTRQALQQCCKNRGRHAAATKKPVRRTGRKVNLLIDIQAKIAAGKGAGYERWAKIFNLKEAAKTLNFLIDNGLTDYDELFAKAEQAGDAFNVASQQIKQLEARMAEAAQHEAAKRAFNALGGKPIPKVAQLSQEYAALLAEKKEQYQQYRLLRQEMIDYQTMKQNVDRILGLEPEAEQEQNKEQKPER